MKELRELRWMIDDAEYLNTLNDDNLAEEVLTTNRAQNLFVAVIDNMPELLDAWEMVEALRWAKQWNVQNSEPDTCHNCPLRKRCFSQETGFMYLCLHAVKFSNEWQKVWRDAHAETSD